MMEMSDQQIVQFESLQQSSVQVNNLDAPKIFFCGGNYPHPQRRASCPASRKTWSLWKTGSFCLSVQNEIWSVTKSSKVLNAMANYKF